ncbi:MAG: hypothetical protein LBQ71_14090 [Hungatella sp.]|jgi:hypothetical protein|nr:hypothetical protein [Hungatella sp.]
MGLFDGFKQKKKVKPDFSEIDSIEKAIELTNQGILRPLYLMPLRFNGEESARNRLFVPPAVVEIKDRYDNMVEDLLRQDKINGYACTPEYKGKSFVPSKLRIVAGKDGKDVFTENINIW